MDTTFFIVLDWATGTHITTVDTARKAMDWPVDGACYYHVHAATARRAVVVAQEVWQYDRSVAAKGQEADAR